MDTLIESAIEGDRDALDQVWKHSRRWVGAILLAHKPREADLEDLLQVVAMQVCRKITDVREPKAFKSWLRTVSINTAREEGRKTTRRKKSMLRLVGLESNNTQHTMYADSMISETDESRRIYDAALSLPAGYREPVLLRAMRSMSYAQIGEVLDLPATTIETRIARGRKMLRELLHQQEHKKQSLDSFRKSGNEPGLIGGAR